MKRTKRKAQIERELERIEKKLGEIEKEEKSIEREEKKLIALSSVRYHPLVMMARGFAGAFLGIVLSSFPFSYQVLNAVPLVNAIILFVFVLICAALVLLKTEKGPILRIRSFTWKFYTLELMVFIATIFLVEYIILLGLGLLATEPLEIVRQMFIFSLPATAGALTLTVI